VGKLLRAKDAKDAEKARHSVSAMTIEVDGTEEVGTALIASDDSVWIPIEPRWFEIATWFWWWLAPADKQARITITDSHGKRATMRSIRIARRYARVRGVPR